MTILTPILICLAVAAILGALWLFAPEAALQATISVGVIAALGISVKSAEPMTVTNSDKPV